MFRRKNSEAQRIFNLPLARSQLLWSRNSKTPIGFFIAVCTSWLQNLCIFRNVVRYEKFRRKSGKEEYPKNPMLPAAPPISTPKPWRCGGVKLSPLWAGADCSCRRNRSRYTLHVNALLLSQHEWRYSSGVTAADGVKRPGVCSGVCEGREW